MRKVILVGASWCSVCKAMENWFLSMSYPGVVFSKLDLEKDTLPPMSITISSAPAIIFCNEDECIDVLLGAVTQREIEKHIASLWPKSNSEELV